MLLRRVVGRVAFGPDLLTYLKGLKMDLIAEIDEKLPVDGIYPWAEGVRAAVRHIRVAEQWLERAREERNEDYFNDVVYRCNQTFEGMLREAFLASGGKDPTGKLELCKVEEYIKKTHFPRRILEMVQRYRIEWRNSSTHGYRLFFQEKEALFSIITVSAFAIALLDYMLELGSRNAETTSTSPRRDALRKELIESGRVKSLVKDVLRILLLAGDDIRRGSAPSHLREVEIIGRVAGIIGSLDPSIVLTRETPLLEDQHLRPDFLVQREDEALVVEVKAAGTGTASLEYGHVQILAYLDVGSLPAGVLFIPPALPQDKLIQSSHQYWIREREVWIHTIAPFVVEEPLSYLSRPERR